MTSNQSRKGVQELVHSAMRWVSYRLEIYLLRLGISRLLHCQTAVNSHRAPYRRFVSNSGLLSGNPCDAVINEKLGGIGEKGLGLQLPLLLCSHVRWFLE